jgi:CheY-like chemotaxis protein
MARVLVVDDEALIRFLIAKVLKAAGHTVVEAGDGFEGLDMIQKNPYAFDLIMLDVRMPKMDGFQFLDLLRQQPFYIPVIVLTAHPNLCRSVQEHRADYCLSKPFDKKHLIEVVDSLVVSHAQQSRNSELHNMLCVVT